MSDGLSHNEILDAITDVAIPVMQVSGLPFNDATDDELPTQTRQAVIEILKHRKHDAGLIEALGQWPPIYAQADERTRIILIALVLAIYNR